MTREQLVDHHNASYGGVLCTRSGAAATLKAALVRDAKLSAQETVAYNITFNWLTSCNGSLTTSDGSTEPCHHPVHMRNMHAGLRWTLSGWKKP
ncbi:hypothetical protein [Streptomyces sp. NBC_01304]|uniref:hypothetical protein n=1 Tax=Streptomyces sp. NBC_01304 TaxID=2903818 RepID=UPI002E1090B3|nr:hypothetical protein OG430_47520 [Streptomyces sp. NBC_01304]